MKNNLKNLNIGVFRGGVSPERDISLISGDNVISALRDTGYRVVDVDLKTTDRCEILDIIRKNGIDIVFIALHGEFGEDGQLQKLFEENKIRFTGSGSLASYLAMDKIQTYKIFEENSIPFPQSRVWPEDYLQLQDNEFPLIVKPHYGGSTLGISIVRNKSEIKKSVEKARKISDKVLIERYIDGREFTVGIINGKVLPVVEIRFKNHLFDYSAKYTESLSEFIAPAELTKPVYKNVRDLSLKVYKVLGCRGAARVDLRMDNDYNSYILELNSVPGLTAHSLLPFACKKAGIEFGDLCEEILESVFINQRPGK